MPLLNVDIFDDVPLRLKSSVNPYVNRLIEAKGGASLPLMFGSQLRPMRGRWREYLSQKLNRPVDNLVLEIGIHKGKVMREIAADHPNCAILGMDVTMKRVVLSAEALKKEGLENGLVILGNAKYLTQIFEPGELDGILIFFPDPWTKKLHQMRKRLVNEDFCKQVFSVLKLGGFFWIKTDARDYWEHAKAQLQALGMQAVPERPFAINYESVFEMRFKNQEIETFEQTLRKDR